MRPLSFAALLSGALLVPFQTACYAPRTDVCRYAESSFDGVTGVELIEIVGGGRFEAPQSLGFNVRARTSRAIGCVGVHSELYRRGELVDVVDTPVTATSDGTFVTTTRVHHSRFSSDPDLELRVTALGATVMAPVPVPPFGTDGGTDAPVADGGIRDAGVVDAPTRDAPAADAPTLDTPDAPALDAP